MIIAVDFDGTCVEHDYPRVGKDVPYGVQVLSRLVHDGHKLILWTMRSDEPLSDAIGWFFKYNIPLHGINSNPNQSAWTNSPKAYAQVYIDDAALGCPLLPMSEGQKRPMVDWLAVEKLLYPEGNRND